VGLGVSAISRADGCYAQNACHLNAYYAQLDHGHLPVERGLAPGADDRLRAELIESLMCRCSVEFSGLEWRHGIRFREYFAAELAALEPMAQDGLVRVAETRLDVTAAGRYLLRAIAMVFDAYQVAAPGQEIRHSRVI
jgi:oxygen-independent coproporphyrinogen-3 oxidase